MTEIISHPDKPLIVHLREVALFCAKTLGEINSAFSVSQQILYDLGYIMGAVHDIGKATENFQVYIKSEGKTVIRPKHHALISAFLAKEIARQYLDQTDASDFDKCLLPYFIFTAVKRHHGHMNNFASELTSILEKEEDLSIQIGNFHDTEVQVILNELLLGINISYNWDDFKAYMSTLDEVFIEFEEFTFGFMLEEFSSIPSVDNRSTIICISYSFQRCFTPIRRT